VECGTCVTLGMKLTRRWLLIAGLYLATAGRLGAQVSGTVVSETEDPIDLVQVELWGETGRLASRLTNRSGHFDFSGPETHDAIAVSFHHLGFAPLRIALDTVPWVKAITLFYEPLALAAVHVGVQESLCPNDEDESARDLWESASGRYSPETAERGMAMRLMFREEQQIPIERVGIFDETRLVYRDHSKVGATWVPTRGRHVNINALIEQNGYAGRSLLPSRAWDFYPIEGFYAFHFASSTFGAAHTFSRVAWGGSQTALVFCTTENRLPAIEGVLLISADTTLQSARWEVKTPRPEAKGGGEVMFAQIAGSLGELPHLVATRGIFWLEERNFPQRYFQRTSIFVGWNVSENDRMPPLP
jgi:hypothetical protein